jgi:hypothetical protein
MKSAPSRYHPAGSPQNNRPYFERQIAPAYMGIHEPSAALTFAFCIVWRYCAETRKLLVNTITYQEYRVSIPQNILALRKGYDSKQWSEITASYPTELVKEDERWPGGKASNELDMSTQETLFREIMSEMKATVDFEMIPPPFMQFAVECDCQRNKPSEYRCNKKHVKYGFAMPRDLFQKERFRGSLLWESDDANPDRANMREALGPVKEIDIAEFIGDPKTNRFHRSAAVKFVKLMMEGELCEPKLAQEIAYKYGHVTTQSQYRQFLEQSNVPS